MGLSNRQNLAERYLTMSLQLHVKPFRNVKFPDISSIIIIHTFRVLKKEFSASYLTHVKQKVGKFGVRFSITHQKISISIPAVHHLYKTGVL